MGGNLSNGLVMTPRPWWRYTHCTIVLYCTDLYFTFKQVYLPTIQRYVPNAMVKPSLTSVILFGVTYMTLGVSRHYKMHLISSTNTVRYSGQVVFILMALTYLIPMQQFITSTLFEHLALQMDFAYPSPNQNTSRLWKSLGTNQVIGTC